MLVQLLVSENDEFLLKFKRRVATASLVHSFPRLWSDIRMGDNITDTRTTALDTEIVPPVVFDVNTTLTSTHRTLLFPLSSRHFQYKHSTSP